MRAFIDKRCPRGHRYGWIGDPSQDPGCDKCASEAAAACADAHAAVGRPSESVPAWFADFISAVQQQQGGIDREAALRSIMRKWGST